ncbi:MULTISPECIES: Mpo1-like protein [unclassified Herbaspirillum]|uniref:Mpo1 family 2-hydroxy fatty acid dioxygenase n=1 Tax=unclassified Herbaspirillum TaxID=2624150 RepID=UPI000E2E4B95|nr:MULTISPECIES: Mpo1-like protein [unclassified Herbaspirillum]RFB69915.1 DUF962 domain-containing protein [Herbaspirillum sp. 3R-3a1]TFI07018.1 DUF962 domain-containing protein [Herbaspirillum sp. 3R11]TFI12956.1 DUF962 domain-containing protein [Herbaspirillum sp. 3R-11]TFI19958.1 DUF962 domain-containing protein [Herbaspirillum sp. 3C11]
MSTLTHRRIDVLLTRYAESHQHHVNELIHCLCVPAIVLALLGLCWSLSPMLAVGLVLVSLAYYFTLSPPFALGMLLMASVMLLVLAGLPPRAVLPASAAIFVIAWIGQFIGHKIEGKKPSFFEDVRFLLIGPLFVLSLFYRRFRIRY